MRAREALHHGVLIVGAWWLGGLGSPPWLQAAPKDFLCYVRAGCVLCTVDTALTLQGGPLSTVLANALRCPRWHPELSLMQHDMCRWLSLISVRFVCYFPEDRVHFVGLRGQRNA